MGWYYYSGKVVRPVPIIKGRSVSIRPNTKIEILDESTPEFNSLLRRGLLRKTGKPKNAKIDDRPIPNKSVIDVVPRSKMSLLIAEKGKTSSKDIPPITKNVVEFTKGEEEVVKSKEDIDVVDEEIVDDKAEELPLLIDKKEGRKKKAKGSAD